MFDWFMDNWLTITLVVGAFYIGISIIENIVVKNKEKKQQKVSEAKNNVVEDVEDVNA